MILTLVAVVQDFGRTTVNLQSKLILQIVTCTIYRAQNSPIEKRIYSLFNNFPTHGATIDGKPVL